MHDAGHLMGVLDLSTATRSEIVEWTAEMLGHAREGRSVSLLVAPDQSHVIALDVSLEEQLDAHLATYFLEDD